MMLHRIQCPACENSLTWEENNNLRLLTVQGIRFLRLNGWKLHYGKWICGNHESMVSQHVE